MGQNVVEKILTTHVPKNALEEADEIGVKIDQTLTQDATGTMVYLQFEAMGFDKVKNKVAVSYVDHNTVQTVPENADDHLYLQTAAARYGAIYSKPGNGICHQLHLERFAVPGQTLLGSDSHTPTAGGIGMFAMGAGGIDVAVAMGGGRYHIVNPHIVRVTLKGRLQPWVSAKDVVLTLLEKLSVKGNTGYVLEYAGVGLSVLDVPDRATIANMGAECGVITSVFPSDEVTRAFLKAQGREKSFTEIVADPDAVYSKEIEIDLGSVEPMAATPHSPGNISSVVSLAGTRVDQVMIGSCTNSSYRDLKTVCKILDGNKIAPGVSLGIAPGSRQVMLMLARDKGLATLLESGARILENACGFCIGNSMAPQSDAVSLRTSNRNFEGRSGTQSARVFLVSPETAALAAIYGRIVDPCMIPDLKYSRVKAPNSFEIDDSMFVEPPKDSSEITVVRGPHMGDVPQNTPIPEKLGGPVAIKVGDNITTDHIMPAGARLKYRANCESYSKFVFEHVDGDFPARAAASRDAGNHNFIIAGNSYGQGSSREHAAMCPMFLGVKAVIALSIERIHTSNLINFGIVPFVFEKKGDYEGVDAGDELLIEGIQKVIKGDGKAVLKDLTRNTEIPICAELSKRQKSVLLAGGLLNYTAKR